MGQSPAQPRTRWVTWGKSLHLCGSASFWSHQGIFPDQRSALISYVPFLGEAFLDPPSKVAFSWPQSHLPDLIPT